MGSYECVKQVAPPPIPLRQPIPERKSHERPIFLIRKCGGSSSTIGAEQISGRRTDDAKKPGDVLASVSEINKIIDRKRPSIDANECWRVTVDDSINGDKLIDLDSSRSIERNEKTGTSVYSSPGIVKPLPDNVLPAGIERRAFPTDFHRNFDERPVELQFKSSFEELRKASRDLEKRLHEGIVRSVVVGSGAKNPSDELQHGKLAGNLGHWEGKTQTTKNGRFVIKIVSFYQSVRIFDFIPFTESKIHRIKFMCFVQENCKFNEFVVFPWTSIWEKDSVRDSAIFIPLKNQEIRQRINVRASEILVVVDRSSPSPAYVCGAGGGNALSSRQLPR